MFCRPINEEEENRYKKHCINIKKTIDSAIIPTTTLTGLELKCNLSKLSDGKLGLIIKSPLYKHIIIYPRLGISFNKLILDQDNDDELIIETNLNTDEVIVIADLVIEDNKNFFNKKISVE